MPESWIHIGVVRSANPSRRELRVAPEPGCERAFDALTRVKICGAAEVTWRCPVAEAVDTGGIWRLSLPPGVNRDSVGRMKGAEVWAPAEDLALKGPAAALKLEPMVGMKVMEETGRPLGIVTAVYRGKANAALEIATPDGRTIALPVIDAVLRKVDEEAATLVLGDIAPYVIDNDA